jgi:pyruvate/2-oxoglutarate dehydrogenase complex dihydrolipoamide dehydrogenase (E3) component
MVASILATGVGAKTVTLTGFFIGMNAAILIASGAYSARATALLASGTCDGQDGAPYEVTRYNLGELDRVVLDGDTRGFVKVLTVPGKGVLLGVTIVGALAAKMLRWARRPHDWRRG